MKTYMTALLLQIFLYVPFAQGKVAATEWGTFTSLLGSNGVTQDGMYHEDEALPNFVHGFGQLVSQPQAPPPPNDEFCDKGMPCRFLRENAITQKMETPVIYFYSGGDLDVTVDVKFPEGVVSETFPGPVFTTPNMHSEPILANGHTTFQLKVHAMDKTPSMEGQLPFVPAGNIYGHARKVNSSVVQANEEKEKFIFYRGVGRFSPRTSITSNAGSLALHQCGSCGDIPAAFLVDVDQTGHARMLSIGTLPAGTSKIVRAADIVGLQQHQPGDTSQEVLRGNLISALTQTGLTRDEAVAMIDTWENGYLKVPGLRVLYILPRQEVETILPVTITPQMPFKRVFVGRLEILLDTEEQALLSKILMARDLIDVKQLGRFAEPILRRISQVLEESQSPAQEDRDLLQRLIERAKTV
jgi:hypothetical protein